MRSMLLVVVLLAVLVALPLTGCQQRVTSVRYGGIEAAHDGPGEIDRRVWGNYGTGVGTGDYRRTSRPEMPDAERHAGSGIAPVHPEHAEHLRRHAEQQAQRQAQDQARQQQQQQQPATQP
jgi:hypothetical protein